MEDSSVGKALAGQGWQPEFNLWEGQSEFQDSQGDTEKPYLEKPKPTSQTNETPVN